MEKTIVVSAKMNSAAASVKNDSKKSILSEIFLKRKKFTDKDKSEFCTQLAVMLQARVSLQKSLFLLSKQAQSEKAKNVIESILKEVHSGNELSVALAKQLDIFDNLFVVTCEVGQETGQLGEVLCNLAQYLERVNALKRKATQAFVYPAMVIGVAVCVISFLLVFIVPSFAEVFNNFQIELPFSTRITLTLSNLLVSYGIYFLIGLLVLVYAMRNFFRSKVFINNMRKVVPKIPFIGIIISENLIARFCRTLGTMLQAQVPLVGALEVTGRIFDDERVQMEIKELLKSVKQGKEVSEHIISSQLFPPMVAQMITVGEESGELDKMLLKVAEFYEKQIDSRLEMLSSVIEPIIMLILGALVAAVLISMYLPMFDLTSIMQ